MHDWQIAMVLMIAYLVVALTIGILAGRGRGKITLDEFTVAGRNLGLFVTWFLMGGAIFSAFSFLGAPGWAFSRGAPALYVIAYTAFAILPWYIIGPKIGRIGRKRGLYSLVGFLQGRYPIKSLAILVGLIVFFASIQYLATQMKGMAIIFSIMTEGRIPFWLGALMAYAIVVIYVATGGLRAAAWSDVFQGLLMIIISWVVGLAIVFQLHGNTTAMFENIAQTNPGFLEIGTEGSTMSPMAFTTIILVSAIGFLMWPHLFSRSYSSKPITIKRTVVAVVAGMGVGFIVNFYYQIINPVTPLDIHAGIIGLMVNVVVFVAMSYLTKPQSANLVNEYVETEKENRHPGTVV